MSVGFCVAQGVSAAIVTGSLLARHPGARSSPDAYGLRAFISQAHWLNPAQSFDLFGCTRYDKLAINNAILARRRERR